MKTFRVFQWFVANVLLALMEKAERKLFSPLPEASFPETLHGRFLGNSRLSIKLETLRKEHVE